jgi:hypothetical protein
LAVSGSKADLASQRSRAGSASYSGDFLDYIGLDVVDGTLHALWSDNRGPTPGTFLADLDAYTARAGFRSDTGANNLVINGDAGPIDDTIVIRRSPRNPDYLEVLVNGQSQYAGLIVSVNAITVTGGDGSDTVRLEDLFEGVTVAVNGGTGSTTLVGPNQANTWDITGTNAGTLDGAVTFTNVPNLTGGADPDTFVFADGQGVTGAIDGGGGGDALDYGAYATSVVVNLQTGGATGVGGGVAQIQNVLDQRHRRGPPLNIGTVAGNGGGNVLLGQGGLDLYFGDPGLDKNDWDPKTETFIQVS